MSTSDANLIQGHEYDGIQEYDNPTPGWWHIIWLTTILGSFVYFFMSLWSPMFIHQTDRLAAAQTAEIELRFADIGELTNDEATLVGLMNDPDWMTYGAAVFKGNCSSCHGSNAEGGVGTNMRDEHFKNVSSLTDIADVIRDGANAGAMPAWGRRLHPNEVIVLSAYVATLRGTPGGVKQAEGVEIAPWPTASELGLASGG
ncbi:MAG: c-type cytochrome [Planctomycetota bacterium]